MDISSVLFTPPLSLPSLLQSVDKLHNNRNWYIILFCIYSCESAFRSCTHSPLKYSWLDGGLRVDVGRPFVGRHHGVVVVVVVEERFCCSLNERTGEDRENRSMYE